MHYDPNQENEAKASFVELQDSMVKELRAIARLTQDMVLYVLFDLSCTLYIPYF